MGITETRKELIDKYEWLLQEQYEKAYLNDWECEFLDSIEENLKAEDGFLTEKQIEKLEEIYEKHNR